MFTESSISTLGEYVAALIDALGRAHPFMHSRMRLIVGQRRARIILDDEAVEVFFEPEGRLHVRPPSAADGTSSEGATNTPTVLKLLDGDLEVSGSILSDGLRVSGKDDDVVRMFMAIEILLDASPRTPALQALAAKFIEDRRWRIEAPAPVFNHLSWYPFRPHPGELQLLAKLDLLPDISS